MITFHIHVHGGGYRWRAVTSNNQDAFLDKHGEDGYYNALRNCMNSIKGITQHMKDGHHDTWLTNAADKQRRERGERKHGARTRTRGRPYKTCL